MADDAHTHPATATVRKAARAIIVTPNREVLLMRMDFPWRDEHLWILPGGGIEQGEDARTAVAREVHEETGATRIDVVGEAWRRESFVEAMNTLLKQRYFLVYANRFEAVPTDLSEQEMDWVREYRWWTVAELTATSDAVEPARLAAGLDALIQHGLPPEPIEIDESFD